MMSYDWEIVGFNRDNAVEFCRHGINPLVSVFLASRGISDLEGAREMLGDESIPLHDPFLMKDMDKAVERIRVAIEKGRRIAVYGDYDVDGMTCVVLLALWLDSKGADYIVYIPGRFDEGYGLNNAALHELKERGAELVITVDCGVTAVDEVGYAQSLGLDLVITDHHECRDKLPKACAVVDPKRVDCKYPYKALAGVGVAFKLICALEGDYLSNEIFRLYGDLVAIGTVADVMPVIGENRELIKRGLAVLSRYPRPGLSVLLKQIGVPAENMTATTIGYIIAPRLNAAGRMGQAELSVNLLLAKSCEESESQASELCRLNSERRSLEQDMYAQAESMLGERGSKPDGPIVLAHHGWHQGVTGIVAAKIAESKNLPTIIISIDEDGVGRGSCRSFGSFAIYDALCACEDILENYGGHEMAAGVTVSENNIEKLQRRMTEIYREKKEVSPSCTLKLDFEVEKPELLALKNVEALQNLEPFGKGNPPPCLCISEAVLSTVISIGSGKHSKMKIEKSGTSLECIFFSVPADDLGVSEGQLVDVAFRPQINEYRGKLSVQLQLLAIRASGAQI